MLWRRFLVRSDSTLADLHGVLQIGFDWTDFRLHRFRIRKKDYAVPRLGGHACHDAREVKLTDLHLCRSCASRPAATCFCIASAPCRQRKTCLFLKQCYLVFCESWRSSAAAATRSKREFSITAALPPFLSHWP